MWAERAVVRYELALECGHPVALDGAGDDRDRPPRRRAQRALEGGVVMAVDLGDDPAEGAELLAQRLEREHVADPAEALEAVRVDDQAQAGRRQVAGERHGLPDRALVELAVADEAEGAGVAAVGAVGEGAAERDRHAVAERARGELDA